MGVESTEDVKAIALTERNLHIKDSSSDTESRQVVAKIEMNLSAISLPSGLSHSEPCKPRPRTSRVERPRRKISKRCASAKPFRRKGMSNIVEMERSFGVKNVEQERLSHPPRTAPASLWQRSFIERARGGETLRLAAAPRLHSAPPRTKFKIDKKDFRQRPLSSSTTSSKLLLQRWDRATRAQRERMLRTMEAFLRGQNNSNGKISAFHGHTAVPQDVPMNGQGIGHPDPFVADSLNLRELYTPGAGLIMLRLLSYLQTSFSLRYPVASCLKVISLLTQATNGNLLLPSVVSGGTMSTILTLISDVNCLHTDDIIEAFYLLRMIALVGGRVVKQAWTSVGSSVLTSSVVALSRAMTPPIFSAGRDFLVELGLDNPNGDVEVKNTLLCLLGNNTYPMAQKVACQAVKALLSAEAGQLQLMFEHKEQEATKQDISTELSLQAWLPRMALFLPPALDLSFSDHEDIRREAEGLVELLAFFPGTCYPLVTGLVGVLGLPFSLQQQGDEQHSNVAWYCQSSRTRVEASADCSKVVSELDKESSVYQFRDDCDSCIPSPTSKLMPEEQKELQLVPELQAVKLLQRLTKMLKKKARDCMGEALVPLALLETIIQSFHVIEGFHSSDPKFDSCSTTTRQESGERANTATVQMIQESSPPGTQDKCFQGEHLLSSHLTPQQSRKGHGPCTDSNDKMCRGKLSHLLRSAATEAVISLLHECTPETKFGLPEPPDKNRGVQEGWADQGVEINKESCNILGESGGFDRGWEREGVKTQEIAVQAKVGHQSTHASSLGVEDMVEIALEGCPDLLAHLQSGNIEGFLLELENKPSTQERIYGRLQGLRTTIKRSNFRWSTPLGGQSTENPVEGNRALPQCSSNGLRDAKQHIQFRRMGLGLELNLCQAGQGEELCNQQGRWGLELQGGDQQNNFLTILREAGHEEFLWNAPNSMHRESIWSFGQGYHSEPSSQLARNKTKSSRIHLRSGRSELPSRNLIPKQCPPPGLQCSHSPRRRINYCDENRNGKLRVWGPEDWDKEEAPSMVRLLESRHRQPLDRSDRSLWGPVHRAVFEVPLERGKWSKHQQSPQKDEVTVMEASEKVAPRAPVTHSRQGSKPQSPRHHKVSLYRPESASLLICNSKKVDIPQQAGKSQAQVVLDSSVIHRARSHQEGRYKVIEGCAKERACGRQVPLMGGLGDVNGGQQPPELNALSITQGAIEFADRYASTVF